MNHPEVEGHGTVSIIRSSPERVYATTLSIFALRKQNWPGMHFHASRASLIQTSVLKQLNQLFNRSPFAQDRERTPALVVEDGLVIDAQSVVHRRQQAAR